MRLGHREGGAQLAAREAGEEARALLPGTEAQQHRRDDEVGVEDSRDAHPAARDLLDREAVRVQSVPAPAELARDGEAEHPELAQALDDRLRVFVRGVERPRDGDDVALDERAQRDQLLACACVETVVGEGSRIRLGHRAIIGMRSGDLHWPGEQRSA